MDILENIYISTLKFLSPIGLDETYKNIVEEAVKIVGGQNGTIFLAFKGELKPVYATSPISYEMKVRRGGFRYEVFKEKQAKILHLKQIKKLKKIHPQIEDLHSRSILLVPLISNNESMGVLSVGSLKDIRFKTRDLGILKLFGSFASLAIRKSQLYEEMAKSIEDRDLFISLASHELRTPLTTINGYIQLLLTKIGQRKPIDNRWVMELAFESQRMKNLIDDFLEINRIRNGKMQFNFGEVSLSEIANHTISTFKFNFPKRKLVVKNILPKNDLIIADADKLHQVFINILENAHKYSKEDKKILFTLKSSPEHFIATIADQGQGIEEKDLPLVFKGFYKGEKSRHEGMGLGLYLAKNILEAHHGSIQIESQLSKGTKVKIKLLKIN